MSKHKPLAKILDEIIIYGGEDGDIEWTLGELQEEASWDISKYVCDYLLTLKVPVPKPVFGNMDSVNAHVNNTIIDELVMKIREGGL